MAFAHVLNLYVLAIFAFCGTFPVESGQIMLFLFFLVASTSRLHFRPNQNRGQGEGEVDPMWTQMGKVMNGVKMSRGE